MDRSKKRPAVFWEWLQSFFTKRELDGPDGRALFRYRLSDHEFNELHLLMKNAALLEGATCLEQRHSFVEVWFFYATEWWKRRYDGDAWSWKRIFDSIGLEEPSHATTSEWVRRSNRYWRLPQHLSHGRKYIGQVVLNGGVPLRLIEGADGHIASVLKSVLRRVVPVSPALSPQQIRDEVAGYADQLPMTFRQSVLLDLLTEIISGVNTLSQLYFRGPVEDPIQTLDLKEPDWRDRFPLELDSESARKLLTGLLREASTAERQSRQPFVLRRGLRHAGEERSRFAVRVELASRFPLSLLAQLLNCTADALPASFDLSAIASGQSRLIGRAVVRAEDVRVETLVNELPAAWFDESIQLTISRYGETLFVLDLPGGEPPELGLPCLFEDVEPFARLIRVGSCKLRADSALALFPGKALVLCDQDVVEQDLISPVEGSRLCRLGAGAWSISHAGECFRIQCGAENEQEDILHWYGRRLYLTSQPAYVFLGMPRLSRLGEDGMSSPVPFSELYWVSGSIRRCLAAAGAQVGAGKLVWQQGKHIQARLSVICLPEDATVLYEAGLSPREGAIRLIHWPAISVAGVSDDVDITAWREGDGWRVDVKAKAEVPPPEFRLRLHWPDGGEQELTLPFPAQGVVLVREDDGQVLPPATCLTVNELVGVRARMLSPVQEANWSLALTLRGRHVSDFQDQRKLVYKSPTQGSFREVRLFELAPMVRQMLGGVEDLDAKVEITFESKGRSYSKLHVARYGYDVEKDSGQGVLRLYAAGQLPSVEVLSATKVLAVPLLKPEEVIELPAQYSEGVANGAWSFNQPMRDPGTWLIYPSPESACHFRPLAWFVPERFAGPAVPLSDLGQALSVINRIDRLEQLSVVFDKLVSDPGHPDWSLLEAMLATLGHLPVSALDVWVALGRHPHAVTMAMLHLEGFAERMINRFSEELPFEWELTSPDDWFQTLSCLRAYWQLDSDRGLRRFIRNAKDCLELLTQHYPVLGFTVNLARVRAGVLIQEEQEGEWVLSERLLRTAPEALWQLRQNGLFTDENCASQRLLRRSTETGVHWPTTEKEQIQHFALSDVGSRLLEGVGRLFGDFKLSAIAYPLMLASRLIEDGAEGWLSTPAALAVLREYRDFDRDWFETAYQAGLTFALIERQNKK